MFINCCDCLKLGRGCVFYDFIFVGWIEGLVGIVFVGNQGEVFVGCQWYIFVVGVDCD